MCARLTLVSCTDHSDSVSLSVIAVCGCPCSCLSSIEERPKFGTPWQLVVLVLVLVLVCATTRARCGVRPALENE